MFICNIKLNLKFIAKLALICMGMILIVVFAFSIYKTMSNNFKVDDSIDKPSISYIESKDYTNVLRSVYDNIEEYIGQKICLVGYVYRQSDFRENEFVLARNMQSSIENQAYIVGFLCDCKEANNWGDGTWIKVTAEISKGDYHGIIPILQILEIEKVEEPANSIVPPPDDTYISSCYIF